MAEHEMCGKERKPKIVLCISGMTGCGKSSVARRLAEEYGLEYFSGGDALKILAFEMGYRSSEKGWWETDEGMRFLQQREKESTFDTKVDEKLLKWAGRGDVVLDSWTMPWLLKKKGFKVWLEASVEVRAERVAGRDGISLERALVTLKKRDEKTMVIYKSLYGFDLGRDFSPFDLVLDSNRLSADEVFKTVCMVVDRIVLGID
ncbi:MAG: cytidylate kinase family protein [Candidatus Bathyarchaeota archaeon]|nr:MAG: cytidylate kinase family protein [Candidatus Bathyarchaeota archaeon]